MFQGHHRQTGKHSEARFLLIYTFQCKAKNIFIEDTQHHPDHATPERWCEMQGFIFILILKCYNPLPARVL